MKRKVNLPSLTLFPAIFSSFFSSSVIVSFSYLTEKSLKSYVLEMFKLFSFASFFCYIPSLFPPLHLFFSFFSLLSSSLPPSSSSSFFSFYFFLLFFFVSFTFYTFSSSPPPSLSPPSPPFSSRGHTSASLRRENFLPLPSSSTSVSPHSPS